MNQRHHRTNAQAASSNVLSADVVVVGARCAGAATAMLLARHGHDVLVVDRAPFPSDTLSTHAIARSGVVQLHRWGLLDEVLASGAPPIRRIEFHDGGTVTARTIKDRYGVDLLVAPRRHVLDPILQGAAVGAGARLRTGMVVDDVLRDAAGRVVGVAGHDADGPVTVRARFVVGADGLRSRIARSVGAPTIEHRPSSASCHYAYFEGEWEGIEYHLGERGFAGVFPTHDHAACIWVCAPDEIALAHRRRTATVDDALRALLDETAPALAHRLDRATATSRARGMMSIPNLVREPIGAGWALVGDAGYHRDATSGHGISDAFRDAELLAVALDGALRRPEDEPDLLATYRAERERQRRGIFEITCAMSAFPGRERFVELQKQLAIAIDIQAGELADRPLLAALAA